MYVHIYIPHNIIMNQINKPLNRNKTWQKFLFLQNKKYYTMHNTIQYIIFITLYTYVCTYMYIHGLVQIAFQHRYFFKPMHIIIHISRYCEACFIMLQSSIYNICNYAATLKPMINRFYIPLHHNNMLYMYYLCTYTIYVHTCEHVHVHIS